MLARDRSRRIGQSAYWGRFAVFMIGVPLLLGFGIYSLFSRDYGLGIVAILAIFPLSIWFRFVMMRRCRDIGWPIFLPWSAQALQFLMVFLLFTSGGLSGGMGAARTVSSGSLLIGFADFVLVIVLGCVRSRHVDVDYAEVFGGEPAALRAHPSPAPYGVAADDRPSAIQAREDAAIERALAAYRDRATEPAAATPRPAPIVTAPRTTGFGRKGL
jgi:uncharacterized membrane protein YhaH (DUF805 family)